MSNRFVVKRRRLFDGVEVTSVVSSPMSRDDAAKQLAFLNEQYQTPGNYYVERWEPQS